MRDHFCYHRGLDVFFLSDPNFLFLISKQEYADHKKRGI